MASAPATTTASAEDDAAARLEQIRRRLVERIFHAAAALGLVFLPMLLWQAHEIGWQPLLKVHGVFVLLALVAWSGRRRLSLAFKSALIVGGVAVLGLFGVYALGMAGAGYWLCLQASVFAATLYSTRTGLVVTALCSVALAVLGFGFSSGMLVVSMDADALLRSASAWSGFLVVVVLGPSMLLFAFNDYRRMIASLVAEADAQRNELAHRVGHDELTGLPQAALAADRLQVALRRAQRNGGKVALLFADLDGFKAINDRHGHAAGDEVLRHVARQLRASVREQDTVARVGGDEFLLILADVQDDAAATRAAAAIIANTTGALHWGQRQLAVGISIGIALYPDHAQDAASLRERADAAMYEAKRGGHNRWLSARVVASGHEACHEL